MNRFSLFTLAAAYKTVAKAHFTDFTVRLRREQE